MLGWLVLSSYGFSFVPRFKGGRAAGGVKGWNPGCGHCGLLFSVLIDGRCFSAPIGELTTER